MKKQSTKTQMPDQLRQDLRQLTSRRPSGIQVEQHIDAAPLLYQLASTLGRVRNLLTRAQARQVQAKLYRWHVKNTRKNSGTVHYTDQTIEAAARILFVATQVHALEPSTAEAKKRKLKLKQLVSFIKSCVDTLAQVIENAETVYSWRHAVLYTKSASKVAGLDFPTILSSETLGGNFALIKNGVMRAIETSIQVGDTAQAEKAFGALSGHTILRDQASNALKRMFEEQAARLPTESQTWIMEQLQIASERSVAEYVNPAESPEIRQAAGILLLLWDHAESSKVMQELLDRFQALCEKHFSLLLKGEVGMVAEYDRRIHEATRPVRGHVKLVRPWVELLRPPKAHVVIRGLVEQIE